MPKKCASSASTCRGEAWGSRGESSATWETGNCLWKVIFISLLTIILSSSPDIASKLFVGKWKVT